MATETLNQNLNEATETLESPPTADKDLPAAPSVQPPSSTTVNGTEDASREEVDGSKVGDEAEASAEAPMEVLPGNEAPGSDVEKKIRRAERFGVPVLLSEDEKRSSRAERFGSASTEHKSNSSKKSEVMDASRKAEETKRKARAERFGLPVPSKSTDEDAKKKARLARFAPPSKVDSVEEDKRKARALRFSEAPASILPEANGKGNIEPKAAIVGKAIGGA